MALQLQLANRKFAFFSTHAKVKNCMTWMLGAALSATNNIAVTITPGWTEDFNAIYTGPKKNTMTVESDANEDAIWLYVDPSAEQESVGVPHTFDRWSSDDDSDDEDGASLAISTPQRMEMLIRSGRGPVVVKEKLEGSFDLVTFGGSFEAYSTLRGHKIRLITDGIDPDIDTEGPESELPKSWTAPGSVFSKKVLEAQELIARCGHFEAQKLMVGSTASVHAQGDVDAEAIFGPSVSIVSTGLGGIAVNGMHGNGDFVSEGSGRVQVRNITGSCRVDAKKGSVFALVNKLTALPPEYQRDEVQRRIGRGIPSFQSENKNTRETEGTVDKKSHEDTDMKAESNKDPGKHGILSIEAEGDVHVILHPPLAVHVDLRSGNPMADTTDGNGINAGSNAANCGIVLRPGLTGVLYSDTRGNVEEEKAYNQGEGKEKSAEYYASLIGDSGYATATANDGENETSGGRPNAASGGYSATAAKGTPLRVSGILVAETAPPPMVEESDGTLAPLSKDESGTQGTIRTGGSGKIHSDVATTGWYTGSDASNLQDIAESVRGQESGSMKARTKEELPRLQVLSHKGSVRVEILSWYEVLKRAQEEKAFAQKMR